MRNGSTTLRSALTGSFNMRWVADLYYAGQRRMANLPISEPSFADDGTALVQSTGSCMVTYTGTFADSLSPVDASSQLSPFGAELAIYVIIDTGTLFSERVGMGWYRITEVPSAADSTALFQGRLITIGSTVKLTLKDRFDAVQADQFDSPGSPPQLTSTFRELTRVSQMQITREVPDKAIARAVAYKDDRLQAVYDLVDGLGAMPYAKADGSLGQRPYTWPAVSDILRQGDTGSLISVGRSMTSDAVYNRVAIRSVAGDQTQILATAAVTSGPLRASTAAERTPFGRRTYFYSSDTITTVDQARAYAPQLLARVSSTRTTLIPITEKFNPLRELGDVVQVVRNEGTFTGRVRAISRSDSPTQDLTLELQ